MKGILIVLFILFSGIGISQNPSFEWGIHLESLSNVLAHTLAADNTGNIYSAGSVKGVVDFDPGVGVKMVNTNGLTQIYLAKYNSNGELIWVKTYTGGRVNDIAIDKDNNIYMVGEFSNQIKFTSGSSHLNLTAKGNSDGFIVKINTSGGIEWVNQVGGTAKEECITINIDNAGDLIISGEFQSTIDLYPLGNIFNIKAIGSHDIFYLKLNSKGQFIWVKQIGGYSRDYINSVAIDSSNNIIACGHFESTADLDPGSNVINIRSNGDYDIFIEKLNPNGELIWLNHIGDEYSEYANSITVDTKQNIYFTGNYVGTLDFDPGPNQKLVSSNGNFTDFYLEKLDANGKFLWVKSIGGTRPEGGYVIESDSRNNIYVSGIFQRLTDFDPGTKETKLIAFDRIDSFIEKFDENGNFIWVQQLGGIDNIYITDLIVDNDQIYNSGYFENTIDFDPGIDTLNKISAGHRDGFIHKLGQCYKVVTIDSITSPVPYTWINGVVYHKTNNSASYTLKKTDGCDSIILLKLKITTSIEETLTKENTVLFPNPNNGQFSVSLKNNAAAYSDFKIINELGKVVYQHNDPLKTNYNIDLAPGIYFVQIKLNNQIATIKMVVN